MRMTVLIGLVLVVLGVLALGYQGFTFFTQERVVDAGPFHIDVSKPHTIIFHPIVGILVLAVGVVMILAGSRAKDA